MKVYIKLELDTRVPSSYQERLAIAGAVYCELRAGPKTLKQLLHIIPNPKPRIVKSVVKGLQAVGAIEVYWNKFGEIAYEFPRIE